MFSIDEYEMNDQKKVMVRRLEDMLRDSDWRSIGGFQTEDTKFANEMSDLVKEMLTFIDTWEDAVENKIAELTGSIDMRDEEIGQYEDTMHKVRAWVEDATRLKGVTDILDERTRY